MSTSLEQEAPCLYRTDEIISGPAKEFVLDELLPHLAIDTESARSGGAAVLLASNIDIKAVWGVEENFLSWTTLPYDKRSPLGFLFEQSPLRLRTSFILDNLGLGDDNVRLQITESYTAGQANALLEDLGLVLGDNTFKFGYASPDDQSPTGGIPLDLYRENAINGEYLMSTRADSHKLRASYGTCQFVHDRQDLHVASLFLLDPEMYPNVVEHVKMLEGEDFHDWYEQAFTGINGLGSLADIIIRNIPYIENGDIGRLVEYFNKHEKHSLKLFQVLYGNRDQSLEESFPKSLARYIDYLSMLISKAKSIQ